MASEFFSGRFDGKVALISGGARGQGRAHARRMAAEGADIITFDVCEYIPPAQAQLAQPEDLDETVQIVENLGGRIVADIADVRDFAAVTRVVDKGLSAFGKIDVVIANAGIGGEIRRFWETSEESWHAVLGVNLIGVWNTVRAAIPSMIEAGNGGSIVMTSSAAGLKGYMHISDYTAAKHGVVGLMRSMAQELGEYSIRVNSVHPTSTNTPLLINDVTKKLFFPDADPAELTTEKFEVASRFQHLLPIGFVEPEDITAAVTWLASDEARYVTGITLPVDAGATAKP
jgi:(+)-trans-carveol dehydrogenase